MYKYYSCRYNKEEEEDQISSNSTYMLHTVKPSFSSCHLPNLTFKYESTDTNVPIIIMSFFNSTTISFPTRVLKKE